VIGTLLIPNAPMTMALAHVCNMLRDLYDYIMYFYWFVHSEFLSWHDGSESCKEDGWMKSWSMMVLENILRLYLIL